MSGARKRVSNGTTQRLESKSSNAKFFRAISTSFGFGKENTEMDKRTAASAHKRIDSIEVRLEAHEAVCGERWKETILRIKRIEGVMIAAAGSIIAMLVAILMKVT